jgi:small subunit ribosomal protein S15
MYLSTEKRAELFRTYSASHVATDSGSAESQIALFSTRISALTEHLKVHRKDKATQTGLLRLVGKRRRLLAYLQKTNIERYRAIIKELGIRR